MNYIWSAMVIASLVCGIITGNIEETISAGFKGASESVTVLLSFMGIMCFWTGILKVAEKSGLSDAFRKLLTPIINNLFPKTGKKAKEYIIMNITANMLGMGNAATPMGVKAMAELDKENSHPLYASDDMCMLAVLNTASIQLIPSTIISLRAAAGSANPASVIVPVWGASLCGAAAAVIAVKIKCRLKRR